MYITPNQVRRNKNQKIGNAFLKLKIFLWQTVKVALLLYDVTYKWGKRPQIIDF